MRSKQMKTILYYPDINLPNNEWLLKALLYWDKISSIVPNSYHNCATSPEMLYLMESGIYQPISPVDAILSADISTYTQFTEEVINAIDHYLRDPNHRKIPTKLKLFHRDKLNFRVQRYIEKERLVLHNDGPWLYVDEKIVIIYMSILVKYLIEISEKPMVLGTDQREYFCTPYQIGNSHKKQVCLSMCLEDILPVPQAGVGIEKIIKFKNKRQLELLQFRAKLDEFERAISCCEEIEEIYMYVSHFKDKIAKEVLDQERLLKDEGIKYKLGTMHELCYAQAPSLVTKILEQQGSAPTWLTYAAIAFGGLAGMIGVGFNYIKHRQEQNIIRNNSGFAYMYDAVKENIISITHNTKEL